MSSPFLTGFVGAVVQRLLSSGQLEIEPGAADSVINGVAVKLATARDSSSLISTMSAALIGTEGVIELYADDDALKELVTDLPKTVLPRGGPT